MKKRQHQLNMAQYGKEKDKEEEKNITKIQLQYVHSSNPFTPCPEARVQRRLRWWGVGLAPREATESAPSLARQPPLNARG